MGVLKRIVAAVVLSALPTWALAQCNGSFASFKNGLRSEAVSLGIAPQTADAFLANVQQDPKVLRADRAQGVFQRPFIDFSRRLISQGRITTGQGNARKYNRTFDRIEQRYGVDRHVLPALWAFETDYGAVQGVSTLPTRWSRWPMIAAGPNCFARRSLPPWNSLRAARSIHVAPQARGPVRSGWSRCCRRISSPMGSMATVTVL